MQERMEKMKALEADIRAYRLTGNLDAIRDLREENRALFAMQGSANAARTQLTQIRQQRARIQANEEMSEDVKRQRLQALREREKAIIERFNALWARRVEAAA